ncbi:MAG TPA: helix-turn-helix transcriptional regulator [Acidobacteriaceae bacterium]
MASSRLGAMPEVSSSPNSSGRCVPGKMVSLYQLSPRLGIDPGELLAMVNGKKIPTKAVLRGLAKELDVDERYLEKLAGA